MKILIQTVCFKTKNYIFNSFKKILKEIYLQYIYSV
jgi:hypothetical protein